MKKVLFATLAMAVAMTGIAQRPVVKNEAKNFSLTAEKPSALRQSDGSAAQGIQFDMPEHMVRASRATSELEEYQVMTTNYDLQSNSAIGNRIATWNDGTASFVATWDNSGNSAWPDRGAGYNFYDGSSTGSEPDARQEPIKSGWPSVAACGDGEILASHATGVNLYYRPKKGEGEWTLLKNWGADYGSPTWPRVICSGPNDEYIHVVMCKQIQIGDGYDNHVYYSRSTDRGQSWSEMIDLPLIDNTAEGEYRNQFSADDYVMAANGNNVAILLGAYTAEVVYIISHDNGETWEKQVVLPWPEEGAHAHEFDDFPTGCTDTLVASDNSHSIAIDNNGTVHVAFGLFRWMQTEADRYTYWPAYRFGIVYWNSNYTNEQGGHEIPLYGKFSQDAEHPEWGWSGTGESFQIDRMDALCEADGRHNLNVFGYVDENGNGQMDYENSTGATWHYRSYGLATMPGVSVDNLGNVAIVFSAWSETRVNSETGFSFRSAYVTFRDHTGTWYADENGINLSEDFMHQYSEVYPTTIAPIGQDGSFWVLYSEDEAQGLYLDINDSYPNSNGGNITDNYLFAVKVTPDMQGWGTNEQEAVNPMTNVRVYPNPATDKLNIEVNASQASTMSINVFNIMGQKVMEDNISLTTGINRPAINTAELSSGIYFVTVKANGFENTLKFIVK